MNLTTRQKDALGHIAENCRKAAEISVDLTRERFAADWRTRYVLIHCVQIVGEAASRMGTEFHSAHPEIPWGRILGMRNRLVHGYDDVNEDLFWLTVTDDLPVLLTQVENILAALD